MPRRVLLLATDPISLGLYLGSWLGYRLNARLPRRAFALALLGFAFASALRLLLASVRARMIRPV